MLTVLDQIANQNHLQLAKAAIPYLHPNSQKMMSVCIKILELNNILAFYQCGGGCVSACSDTAQPPEMIDILTDMRNYCEGSELQMIDQWIQMISTIELFSLFSQSQDNFEHAETSDSFFSSESESDPKSNP
ncbi:MAG: hypothetical protein SOX32_01265 [Candidatus Choladocola sp.]|nr:hypothetical protein [Candidatus Choladocola sp.]